MSLTLLAMLGLATFRLTRLITSDEITRPARERVLEHAPAWAAYLVACAWCVSVWTAAGIVAAADAFAGVALPVLAWPAAAAISGLISEHFD